MACLCKGTFPFQGRLVVWSRWHGASSHPLGANKKRRRCTLALDSESPLVHSTQITKLARPELDPDRRAEQADLICLLTDGSPITHSLPPASHVEMEWPPTVRLERAHRQRTWLLLNMKCQSLGMSTLFRSGEAQRIDSFILEINRGALYDIPVCLHHIWLSSSWCIVWCLDLLHHRNNQFSWKTHFYHHKYLTSLYIGLNCSLL